MNVTTDRIVGVMLAIMTAGMVDDLFLGVAMMTHGVAIIAVMTTDRVAIDRVTIDRVTTDRVTTDHAPAGRSAHASAARITITVTTDRVTTDRVTTDRALADRVVAMIIVVAATAPGLIGKTVLADRVTIDHTKTAHVSAMTGGATVSVGRTVRASTAMVDRVAIDHAKIARALATIDETMTGAVSAPKTGGDMIAGTRMIAPALTGMTAGKVVTGSAVLTDHVMTDHVVTDRVTTDRVTTDRVTTDRVTTDRVTTDRVTTDRVTTDRVTTDHGAAGMKSVRSVEVITAGKVRRIGLIVGKTAGVRMTVAVKITARSSRTKVANGG
ncbi:hypothetical protein GCM10023187_49870 [Nibrella viscosa]|uniref:Uncharacterized protein n=1 Tax=Nibrella viscosa TaxID=1084524 RepID=A0ABP8KW69_9BACT